MNQVEYVKEYVATGKPFSYAVTHSYLDSKAERMRQYRLVNEFIVQGYDLVSIGAKVAGGTVSYIFYLYPSGLTWSECFSLNEITEGYKHFTDIPKLKEFIKAVRNEDKRIVANGAGILELVDKGIFEGWQEETSPPPSPLNVVAIRSDQKFGWEVEMQLGNEATITLYAAEVNGRREYHQVYNLGSLLEAKQLFIADMWKHGNGVHIVPEGFELVMLQNKVMRFPDYSLSAVLLVSEEDAQVLRQFVEDNPQ